jgi:queuosine precursor transporter
VDRKQYLYVWLGGLFVAALIVADLIGGRFFRVGSVDLSVGMLAFPLTFVLTDVINEFYGTVGARRITYVGLGTAVFAFLVINVALALPPSPKGLPDEVFRSVFGWSRRLYVASLAAYLVGQLSDITFFGLFRRLTRHRLLWLRATGSTLISQAIDTVVVNFVLLSGRESPAAITRIVFHSYLTKIVAAVALTPLIYAAHALILRVLEVREPAEPGPLMP